MKPSLIVLLHLFLLWQLLQCQKLDLLYNLGRSAQLPESFDLRVKYPQCTSLHTIFDQGSCGGCWAAASTGVFSDMLCIKSNGKINTMLSVEHTLSCSDVLDPCSGAIIHLDNLRLRGRFMAGITNGQCWPYTQRSDDALCSSNTCPGAGGQTYKASDVFSVTPWVLKTRTEAAIMDYLYNNGSVWVRLKMTTNDMTRFKSYVPGSVFECLENIGSDEAHIVKLIGWGNLNGKQFWIGQNSWPSYWGMKGYFYIARGPYGPGDTYTHYGTCSVQSAAWSVSPIV